MSDQDHIPHNLAKLVVDDLINRFGSLSHPKVQEELQERYGKMYAFINYLHGVDPAEARVIARREEIIRDLVGSDE